MLTLGQSFLLSLSGSLVAAFIAFILGGFFKKRMIEKIVESAPKIYTERLGKLIFEAGERLNTIPNDDIAVYARSIVSTRDDLRSHMINISSILNSEIDRLAQAINYDYSSLSVSTNIAGNVGIDFNKIKQTIKVLAKNWPAKKDLVEVEIRKIIAELGFQKFL